LHGDICGTLNAAPLQEEQELNQNEQVKAPTRSRIAEAVESYLPNASEPTVELVNPVKYCGRKKYPLSNGTFRVTLIYPLTTMRSIT
jgi:hypothetical protein